MYFFAGSSLHILPFYACFQKESRHFLAQDHNVFLEISHISGAHCSAFSSACLPLRSRALFTTEWPVSDTMASFSKTHSSISGADLSLSNTMFPFLKPLLTMTRVPCASPQGLYYNFQAVKSFLGLLTYQFVLWYTEENVMHVFDSNI